MTWVRRLQAEDGTAGGAETLAFGFLVFVVGTALVLNAWLALDAKLAVAAAAREGVRAFVEADDGADAVDDADRAVRDALTAHRLPLRRLTRLDLPDATAFVRCRRVEVTLVYATEVIRLPWFRTPTIDVRSSHSEVVDPYRSGVGQVAADQRGDCAAP